MRVLLSTIGSRGDVQPLVALATHLKSLGHEVRLCVPPDFREWIDVLGLPVAPIGPELRRFTTASAGKPALPSAEQRRQMVEGTVATQFETIAAVAMGCDILVGATALQIAAPSVAEKRGIPYVFAAYCPAVLPSLHHAPPPLPPIPGQTPWPATTDNRELWARSAARFNETFGPALNSHRAAMGLPLVGDVSRHVFTERPWLAADPVLGPWPDPKDEAVFQTGAWILSDERSLTRAIRAFLDAGDPPIYFGFGSMRAPQDTGKVVIEAARALGRRGLRLTLSPPYKTTVVSPKTADPTSSTLLPAVRCNRSRYRPRAPCRFHPHSGCDGGVLHADEFEELFPIRQLLGERRVAEADFDPFRRDVRAQTGRFHVAQVFIAGNGAGAERAGFDRPHQGSFFAGPNSGSDQIAHGEPRGVSPGVNSLGWGDHSRAHARGSPLLSYRRSANFALRESRREPCHLCRHTAFRFHSRCIRRADPACE
jgi:UDP:flavonoid glycosyltransferase YjiC (YdhE family)